MTEITTRASRPVLWRIGFRPFFLIAGLWAVAAMARWFGMLSLGWRFNMTGLTASQWHAHEMIFGFTMAVIAGFLLTAVPNWIDIKPLAGSDYLLSDPKRSVKVFGQCTDVHTQYLE